MGRRDSPPPPSDIVNDRSLPPIKKRASGPTQAALFNEIRHQDRLDQWKPAPPLVVRNGERSPHEQSCGQLNCIWSAKLISRTQRRGLEQNVAADGLELQIRKIPEQQFVIIGHIL